MYLKSTVSSIQPRLLMESVLDKRVMAKQGPPGIFLSVSERVIIIIIIVIRVSPAGRKNVMGGAMKPLFVLDRRLMR